MLPKRKPTRTLALLLTAGALSLALTASAAAIVYVYGNGFSSRGAYKEIKRSGGGGKKCDKRYREKAKSMGAAVKGKRLCEFSPPVVGDAAQPDHVIFAKGQILPRKTPKALRKSAYLAVKLRLGRGDWYELQIRPKSGRYKLDRSPSANAVSEAGRSDAIRKLNKPNALRLEAKGARIRASVNGDELVSVVDPNPDQVGGRKVGFGIGSRKNSSRPTVGSFTRVRVGIAE
jgi:hypothetical protein